MLVRAHSQRLLRFRHHTFIFSALDVVQCALEMLPWVFERRGVFVGLQVRMNQLDETIQVLHRYLSLLAIMDHKEHRYTHCFVLLIKIIYVSVQYLDEQFDGYSSVHAGVSHTKRTLQALKNSLSVTVKLLTLVGELLRW